MLTKLGKRVVTSPTESDAKHKNHLEREKDDEIDDNEVELFMDVNTNVLGETSVNLEPVKVKAIGNK